MIESTHALITMKPQPPSERVPAVAGTSRLGAARAPSARSTVDRRGAVHRTPSTAAARHRRPPAYVYDLRIFAIIGDEVVEVLWDQPVDDPTEILVRRIDGSTYQQPIHLLNDVELLR